MYTVLEVEGKENQYALCWRWKKEPLLITFKPNSLLAFDQDHVLNQRGFQTPSIYDSAKFSYAHALLEYT
jgi:hypothetical protein